MAKRQVGPIEGGEVRLRLLEEADLPMTLAWRNEDHIRKWFLHSDIITEEQHRSWFDRYSRRDDDFVFIIEETEDLWKPVGQISLYNIDWGQRTAEYGRLMIGERDAVGKRLAKKATKLLLDYAFGSLGLEKIELEVLSGNAPALAIYRSCGFFEVSERDGLKKMIKVAR